MIVPLLVGWDSTSSKPRGAVSAGNRRARPPPATTGLITRVSSSSRSCSIRLRTSVGLPAVPMFPPGCSFRSATNAATDPVISVLLGQSSTDASVVEATYFGLLLIQLAKGSSVDVGQ